MASAADGAANQLHRELLRWIQSLDLAYSIKNVKRDFANGFLVAEILSRYYDKDISMHSFDNGIGVKVKKDNWDQLLKVFVRVPDLELLATTPHRAAIDAVIHCQHGAAVAFLTTLYQCLTKRTILPVMVSPAPPAAPAKVDGVPPYAKPTGTALIRDKMRGADIAETSDENEVNRKLRRIHSQHEEQLQLERLQAIEAPQERYPSLRSANKATVLRGATRPVRNDADGETGGSGMTQHVVKEVQIKSMNEKSLEKLRLSREAKQHEALSGGGGGGGGGTVGAAFDHYGRSGGGAPGGGAPGGSSTGELIQKRRPLDLLSETVSRKLPPAMVAKLDTQRGQRKFDAFLDALHDHRVAPTDHDAADLFTQVVDDPLMLAHAFLDFPHEFWHFTGVLLPFLTEYDDDHAVFQAVQHALLRVGRQAAQRDGAASLVLLADFVLPRIMPLLASHPAKRAPLLELAYAFSPATVVSHLHVLKRLREALATDIPLFIHALSILLPMESDLDETLVDLYHYYCCIGLETPCAKLRAASLSMLVRFVGFDLSLVADLLPRLTHFSSRDAWWEVKTQLLVVAAAFLHAVAAAGRDMTDQIELALTLVEREFHPVAHLNVRRVGLSFLAKNLSQYQELVPLYIDVLLSLPLSMRTAMLLPPPPGPRDGDEDEASDADHGHPTHAALPVRGASGALYALRPLAPQWDAVAVAKQIYYERKAGRADVDALQVLYACFAQATTGDAAALYEQMQGFLAAGLLDAAACGVAAQLLLDVMQSGACAPRVALAGAPLRQALATLVTRQVDDLRQQCAVKMLHDAHALDADAVAQCVQALAAQSDAAAFRGSLFSISFGLPEY